MKKLKLVMGICALLLGGASAAYAQKDVTSQYITNATLSSLDGWTSTHVKNTETNNPADAFTVSTRGNNTVGYATEAYAGWGSLIQTEYSMKQTITLPAGNYRLVNYSFYRQGAAYNTDASKSSAYLVAGEKKVALKTLGSITAAGYANSQAEGANVFDSKMYRNVVEFTIDADNTPIEIGVEGTFDEAKCWCIVGQFELFDLDDLASVSSPTDVTYAITNPGFEYRDQTGWVRNPDNNDSGIKYQDNSWGNKRGIGFAEAWQWSAGLADRSITQELTGLNNGLYELSVYAHNINQRDNDAACTGMFLTANDEKTEIGAYGQYKVRTTITDGTLTIGVKLENCGGNWIAFDAMELQFYGDPTAAYKDLLDEAIAAVEAYYDEIPSGAKADAQDKVTNYTASLSVVSDYEEAISNLNELEESLNAIAVSYSIWNTIYSGATALAAVANDNTSANTTFSEAVSKQNTDVKAATTAKAIDDAIVAVRAAGITYIAAASPSGDNRFDISFLFDGLDVSNLAGETAGAATGWSTEQDGGNFQVIPDRSIPGVQNGEYTKCVEYWSENPRANDKFNLYKTVALPEGTYKLTAQTFATQLTGGSVRNVVFAAGDVNGSAITSDNMSEQAIDFVQANSEVTEVKVGLRALTGNNARWCGIGYVKIYKVKKQTFDLDEDVAFTPESAAGDVTLKRTIYSGFNTVVLPFSLTESEVATVLGEGELYEFDDADAGSLNFNKVTALNANVPYLFKATADKAVNTTIENRTIAAVTNDLTSAGTDYNFVGTYTPYTKDADKNPIVVGADYVLGSDNTFHKTTVKNALKAFRAYIQANEADESGESGEAPARLRIVIDGETTGIDAIDGRVLSSEGIYNLQGQKVEKAQKGIFIQNGKKVVVK